MIIYGINCLAWLDLRQKHDKEHVRQYIGQLTPSSEFCYTGRGEAVKARQSRRGSQGYRQSRRGSQGEAVKARQSRQGSQGEAVKARQSRRGSQGEAGPTDPIALYSHRHASCSTGLLSTAVDIHPASNLLLLHFAEKLLHRTLHNDGRGPSWTASLLPFRAW
eukprot:1137491-Pelagomonas_calceolata.AAC.4